MVTPGIDEIERGPPELDRALPVHDLIGHDDDGRFQDRQPLLGATVRHHDGAGVLERLAAGNVIVMMVAVDQVLDRRLRDLPDFIEIGLYRLRPAITDRIGDDDAGRRHDEHRLMVLIAKDVDVVGAFDLGGREQRWRGSGCRRLCMRDRCETDDDSCRKKCGANCVVHSEIPPAGLTLRACQNSLGRSCKVVARRLRGAATTRCTTKNAAPKRRVPQIELVRRCRISPPLATACRAGAS